MIETDKVMLAFMKYGLVVCFTSFIVATLIGLGLVTPETVASNAVVGVFALIIIIASVAFAYVLEIIVTRWLEKRKERKANE